MSEPPLVIFDCDGVLVETELISSAVDREILLELGWDLSIEEIAERFVGGTSAHFLSVIESHFGGPLGFDWRDRYGDRYRRAFADRLVAVDGIADVLESLDRPFCVASNSTPDHVRTVLETTGLAHHFGDRIFSAAQVSRGKPAPDLFLHAAATFGRFPVDCIVVEDSVPGVSAARAAGMPVLGYVGGLTRRERLQPLCTAVFDRMADLPGMLDTFAPRTPRPSVQ